MEKRTPSADSGPQAAAEPEAGPVVARPIRFARSLALVAGVASATGFQPLGWWPATLAAFAVLLGLVGSAPDWRRAALTGWLFGVGHFVLGNNWIATAFTYQAEMPASLGWVAVVLLALYLALYPALATLGTWLIVRSAARSPASERSGTIGLVLAFAGLWTITEWLRSWVFTGFVWNPLGMVALGGFTRPGLAALAPWLGTYALSAVIALLAGCWLLAARLPSLPHKVALVIAPVAALLLPQAITYQPEPGRLRFTLVQPNVPQDELTDPSRFESQFRRTASLSLARVPGERRVVLWPESGVPDYLRPGYPQAFYEDSTFAADPRAARERIGKVIGPGSLLLTGAVDLVMRRGEVVAADNSVTALDGDGRIRAGYIKSHLVPYGEYLPMRGLLEPLGLSRLVAGTLDFRAGPGPRTLDLRPWGRIGIQVCYEIIFSGRVVEGGNRPEFLFNPSNDGWFGAFGPPQHLAQARMRAIEEGLPVLRSTTNGVSAVIDANGVVRAHLPQHVAGRLDGRTPRAHSPTPFARVGSLLPLGWAILLLGLSLVALRARRR